MCGTAATIAAIAIGSTVATAAATKAFTPDPPDPPPAPEPPKLADAAAGGGDVERQRRAGAVGRGRTILSRIERESDMVSENTKKTVLGG